MGQMRYAAFAIALHVACFALVLVLLTACQTPKGDFCQIAHPIRLSQQAIDAMSDEEVKEALAHNRLGARLCKWKP